MPEIPPSPPSSYAWYSSISAQDLAARLHPDTQRLTSLQHTPGGTLAAVHVDNTGAAHQDWGWTPDSSASGVASAVGKHRRLVSLSPFVTGQTLHLAAVWVDNTGPAHISWDWSHDISPADLDSTLTKNRMRPTCLATYELDGVRKFCAVWVDNTGAHHQTHWWKGQIDPDSLLTRLVDEKARLTSLFPFVKGGKLDFSAIWVPDTGTGAVAWEYDLGIDDHALGQFFDLYCAYPVDLNAYELGGGRRLACVMYHYPPEPDPEGASLVGVSGAAGVSFPTVDSSGQPTDLLNQEDDLTVTITSSTSSTADVDTSRSELWSLVSGGWVNKDFVVPLFGPGGSVSSATSIPPGTLTTTGGWYPGSATTHFLVRLAATSGGQAQYSHTAIPMVNAGSGYTPPPAVSVSTPVFIGTWSNPAEIFPCWHDGNPTKWLTVGGQIVNGSGETVRLGRWNASLVVDGKHIVGRPLPKPLALTFYTFVGDDYHDIAVVDGVAQLEYPLNFFVIGFDAGRVPDTFGSATVRIEADYKVGDRCGAAVFEAPVVLRVPVQLRSPLGKPVSPAPAGAEWYFGNAPDKTGYDVHSWPMERFSYDVTLVTKHDGDWVSLRPGTDDAVNGNFYAYGQPVLACADGEVVQYDFNELENNGAQGPSDGQEGINYVVIRHRTGTHSEFSGYYHLQPRPGGMPPFDPGQPVSAGDVIGYLGNSGGSSEPHLHFGYIILDETGRVRTVPMEFSDLHGESGSAVTGMPGYGRYTVGGEGGAPHPRARGAVAESLPPAPHCARRPVPRRRWTAARLDE